MSKDNSCILKGICAGGGIVQPSSLLGRNVGQH